MKNKLILYVSFIILSILLFIVAMLIFNSTKFIAPIIIVISIYLFVGSLINLCKMNNKFKNTIYVLICCFCYHKRIIDI